MTDKPDLILLSAIEDLNRSVDVIGLLLFGEKYSETLTVIIEQTDTTPKPSP